MPNQENRVRKLEDDDGGTGDIEITIQHEQTYLDKDGERHHVPATPTGFEESEWSSIGNGARMRVRKPRYD